METWGGHPHNLFRQQRKKASPGAKPFSILQFPPNCQMSLGPSLPLAPCSTRERQSTRAKHRSRAVVITREARGRAPRVLTAPFGLDRSPANDGPNGLDVSETSEYHKLDAARPPFDGNSVTNGRSPCYHRSSVFCKRSVFIALEH